MMGMPKKTKTPGLVRPELIPILAEILSERGLEVSLWPADEAAAYRDSGGFMAGREAIRQVRLAKAAAEIETVFGEALRVAELKAYVEGVCSAQAMTGFSDETFQSILDKEGITDTPLDGSWP